MVTVRLVTRPTSSRVTTTSTTSVAPTVSVVPVGCWRVSASWRTVVAVAEGLPKEKLRFRQQLQRLTQRIPGVAWLHPTPKHGMQRWIPELASGTPVQLIHQ